MKVVVVMPFDRALDAVYSAIKASVETAVPRDGLTCLRVDEDLTAGHITGKIEEHLRSADICIADISGLNPNVMWEVGYIEALRKPLLLISQSLAKLPFNIQDMTAISYAHERLDETLVRPLMLSLQQTLTTVGARRTSWSIAITGSHSIMPNKAAYAVRTLASPYLGAETTWYCGTNGAADYEAARFLLEMKQNVVCVYAGTHDVAADIRALFALHSAPLLDAETIALPRAISELSRRDAFFVTRADLVLLLWDGQSRNIGKLHEWLTLHHKDHLLGNAW